MRKKILWATGAFALVALIAIPVAYAQHGRGVHGDGFAGPMMLGHLKHAKEALGLSDQQVTDIKTAFQDMRQQNQAYRQSLHGTMQQVAQILIKNPNDVAAAQALLDQQMANERTMHTNALNAASKALNMLTPDQRTKLSTMVQEHFDRHSK